MSNASTDQAEADEGPLSSIDDGPIELPEIVPATIDDEPIEDEPVDERGDGVPAEPTPDGHVARVAEPLRTSTMTVPDRPVVQPADDPVDGWVAPAAAYGAVDGRRGATAPLRAPGRRPRVRRVTRVVRHIDPWSTFKVALIFSVVLYGVLLTAGVLLWNVASNTGTVDNVERWFTQFGWETFELRGGEIFHNAWIAGLFGVVGLTGFAVLSVTLFNLVSDIVGGVRLTVLEEEVVERTATSARRYVVRRPPSEESAGVFDLDGDLGPGRDLGTARDGAPVQESAG